MTAITNCVVKKGDADVLTNPTSAELYDDLKPTMHIIITGGTVGQAPVKSSSYKISGTVSGLNRNFIGMVCKSATSPYRFDK